MTREGEIDRPIRRSVLAVVVISLAPLGCPRPDAPPERIVSAPERALDFFVDSRLAIRKVLNPAAPSAAWGPANGVLHTLPVLDLVAPSDIRVQYRSSRAHEPRQTQILLFARDPHEHLLRLESFTNDHAAWVRETTLCGTPLVRALQSPSNVPSNAPGTSTSTLTTQTFWPPPLCRAAAGPGAAPNGLGSLKSAVVYERGKCSSVTPIEKIITKVQTELFLRFATAVTAQGCADAERVFSDASAFIDERHVLSPDVLPRGGFVLSFYFRADTWVPLIKDNNIRYNYTYVFDLSDGILTVKPERNHGDVNGFDDDSINDQFGQALGTTLPDEVTKEAENQQAQFVLPFSAPCTQVSQGVETIPADSNVCGQARQTFEENLRQAAADGRLVRLGSTNPSADASRLIATVNEIAQGKWHNWRCKRTDDSGDRTVCAYVARAKRINVYPDAVELVWFDDPLEPAAGATAAPVFVFLKGLQPAVASAIDRLCTPRSADAEEFSRSYTVSNLPSTKVKALGGVSTCTEAKFHEGIMKMNSMIFGDP